MCAMAQPQWTKREERRGVDPLGMQSTSVSLYQRLVPGISNVTLRMRYYGLYAWLADQYARTEGNTSVEGWRKYIRRSEALYALIVRSSTQENGVAGTRWAKRKLDAVRGPWVTFAEHADDGESTEPQYLKQSFGAYGAAYGTQLFEMGIRALHVRFQMESRVRELAHFNLGIDSKLRGCDLVALTVGDVCHGAHVASRAIVVQHKTQRPVPTPARYPGWPA